MGIGLQWDRLGRYQRPVQVGITVVAALGASLLIRDCTTGSPINSTAPLPDAASEGPRFGLGPRPLPEGVTDVPAVPPDEVLGVTIARPDEATPARSSASGASTPALPTLRIRFAPASTYLDVAGATTCAPDRSGHLGRTVSVLGESSSTATARIVVRFAAGPAVTLTRAGGFTGALSPSAQFSCAGVGPGPSAAYTAQAFTSGGTLQRTVTGTLPFTSVD